MNNSPHIDLDAEGARVTFLEKRERIASVASFFVGVIGAAVIGVFMVHLTLLGMLGALDQFGKIGLVVALFGGVVATRILIRGVLRVSLKRWSIALHCLTLGNLRYRRLLEERSERWFG
jgi:hypothetical protein